MIRKFFFILAVLCGTVTVHAQFNRVMYKTESQINNVVDVNSMRVKRIPQMSRSLYAERVMLAGTAAPEAEAWYDRPYNAFVEGMDQDWLAWNNSRVYTPGMVEVYWQNYSMLDGKLALRDSVEWTEMVYEDGVAKEIRAPGVVNRYGDLYESLFGIKNTPYIHVYAPEDKKHVKALASYQYHADTEDVEEGSGPLWRGGSEGLVHLGNANPMDSIWVGYGSGLNYESNADFSIFVEDESGKTRVMNTGKKCVGFAEYFSAPGDLLYAESVSIKLILSKAGGKYSDRKPLEGDTLFASVQRFDENGFTVVAEAFAVDEDVTLSRNEYNDVYCSVNFRFMDYDPVFQYTEAPIVLDGEYDYMVVISGFDRLGSKWYCPFADEKFYNGNAYALLDDGSFETFGYYPWSSFFISFYGALPVAEVVDEMKDVVVRISEDGRKTMTIYDDVEKKWYEDYAILTLDSAKNWNVFLDEDENWISVKKISDEYIEYGQINVFIGGEPLPAGIKGRQGTVELELFGKIVEIPVVQGEVESAVGMIAQDDVIDWNGGDVVDMSGRHPHFPTRGKAYIVGGNKTVFE